MIANDDLFWYRASYIKNHDGDTVTVTLDLGFNMFFHRDVRLYGINTPEMTGTAAAKAKDAQRFLESILKATVGTDGLRVKSFKDQDDKYGGRVLGELWAPVKYGTGTDLKSAHFDITGEWTNLNQLMVKAGFATAYFGVGAKV